MSQTVMVSRTWLYFIMHANRGHVAWAAVTKHVGLWPGCWDKVPIHTSAVDGQTWQLFTMQRTSMLHLWPLFYLPLQKALVGCVVPVVCWRCRLWFCCINCVCIFIWQSVYHVYALCYNGWTRSVRCAVSCGWFVVVVTRLVILMLRLVTTFGGCPISVFSMFPGPLILAIPPWVVILSTGDLHQLQLGKKWQVLHSSGPPFTMTAGILVYCMLAYLGLTLTDLKGQRGRAPSRWTSRSMHKSSSYLVTAL